MAYVSDFEYGTGSLINSGELPGELDGRYILTAAHLNPNGIETKILFELPRLGNRVAVEIPIPANAGANVYTINHPGFDTAEFNANPQNLGTQDDIALWRLVDPVNPSPNRPLVAPFGAQQYRLNTETDEVAIPATTEYTIAGYGATGIGTNGEQATPVPVKRAGRNIFDQLGTTLRNQVARLTIGENPVQLRWQNAIQAGNLTQASTRGDVLVALESIQLNDGTRPLMGNVTIQSTPDFPGSFWITFTNALGARPIPIDENWLAANGVLVPVVKVGTTLAQAPSNNENTLIADFDSGQARNDAMGLLFGVAKPDGSGQLGVAPDTEEQSITISGADGGTFQLGFRRSAAGAEPPFLVTGNIPRNATALQVQEALRQLAPLAQVTVVAEANGGPYTVYFGGALAGVDVNPMVGSSESLTSTNPLDVQRIRIDTRLQGSDEVGFGHGDSGAPLLIADRIFGVAQFVVSLGGAPPVASPGFSVYGSLDGAARVSSYARPGGFIPATIAAIPQNDLVLDMKYQVAGVGTVNDPVTIRAFLDPQNNQWLELHVTDTANTLLTGTYWRGLKSQLRSLTIRGTEFGDDTIIVDGNLGIPVVVEGRGGANSLTINDTVSNVINRRYSIAGDATTMKNTVIFEIPGRDITFASIQTFELKASDFRASAYLTPLVGVTNLKVIGGIGESNAFTIAGTTSAITRIEGRGSADQFYVQASGAGTATTILGSAGWDRFYVSGPAANQNLDAILGTVAVNGNGGLLDELEVNDRRAWVLQTYLVRADFAGRDTPVGKGTAYSGIKTIRLYTSMGNDTINIQGTAAGASTLIYAGDGVDWFKIGNATNTVSDVLGRLMVDGEGQGADITINDQGSARRRPFTDERIGAPNTIFTTFPTGVVVQQRNFNSRTRQILTALLEGPGGNDVRIGGGWPLTTTEVFGSADADSFLLGNAANFVIAADARTINQLNGEFILNGGDGTDYVEIEDSWSRIAATFTIGTDTVSGGRGAGFQSTLDSVENVAIYAGSGGDTFVLNSPSLSRDYLVAAGDGYDTAVVALGITATPKVLLSDLERVQVTAGTLDLGEDLRLRDYSQSSTGTLKLHVGSGSALGHLIVSGGVTLAGTLTLDVTTAPTADAIMLIEKTGTGDIIGSFTGYAEGAAVTLSGHAYNISYHGGNGNDVVLRSIRVTGMSPISGTTTGAQAVWLSGAGFSSANITSVAFDGVAAPWFHVNSDSEIVALTPAHGAGAVNVTVHWGGGSLSASGTTQYTYVASGKAQVLNLTTSADPSTAGNAVTFTATRMTGASATSASFYLDGVLQTTLTFNGSGIAQWTTSALAAGRRVVSATAGAGNSSVDQIVRAAPSFTSANATTFTVGTVGGFPVTTSIAGYPAANFSIAGTMPAGTDWIDNFDGTMTLFGSAEVGMGGVYPLTLSATNGVGSPVTQAFTLTMNERPRFLSDDMAEFQVGTNTTFSALAVGYPNAIAMGLLGTLPDGLTFTNGGNGTATIGGTPATGTGGTYYLTLTANNGVGSPREQTFTIRVSSPPVVLSVTPNGNIGALAGVQHSRVASLVVVFDQAVELDANAFALSLHTNNVSFSGVNYANGYGTLPTSLELVTEDNITWIVTFVGNTDDGEDGYNSIRDGVYDLNIIAAKVHSLGVPDFDMAAGSTFAFHRLYGDVNATMTPDGGTEGVDFVTIVSTADYFAFSSAFNNLAEYQAFLDFTGNGHIAIDDRFQFLSRFNKPLIWRV